MFFQQTAVQAVVAWKGNASILGSVELTESQSNSSSSSSSSMETISNINILPTHMNNNQQPTQKSYKRNVLTKIESVINNNNNNNNRQAGWKASAANVEDDTNGAQANGMILSNMKTIKGVNNKETKRELEVRETNYEKIGDVSLSLLLSTIV